jgi:hypothetical protein
LRRVFRGTRHQSDVEALVRVMVFNRLCDPESKLGVLRWLETVALPDRPADITHQHLLRSMDALMEHRDAVDRVVARLLRPLIDQDLSVVFYDLTTIRAEGDSMQEGDVRRFGMAKEGVIARQFLLGVVQTAEGVPIYHEVFDGNVAETRTLLPTLATVLERFPSVRRLILVADRGLLSLDNLEALREIRLANGRALEFILAVPGRRYNEFLKELRAFHKTQCQDAQAEVITEQRWHDLRLIVAHDPATAAEQTGRRNERIAALIDQANAWADKLDAQDLGETRRGRPLSDRGATARGQPSSRGISGPGRFLLKMAGRVCMPSIRVAAESGEPPALALHWVCSRPQAVAHSCFGIDPLPISCGRAVSTRPRAGSHWEGVQCCFWAHSRQSTQIFSSNIYQSAGSRFMDESEQSPTAGANTAEERCRPMSFTPCTQEGSQFLSSRGSKKNASAGLRTILSKSSCCGLIMMFRSWGTTALGTIRMALEPRSIHCAPTCCNSPSSKRLCQSFGRSARDTSSTVMFSGTSALIQTKLLLKWLGSICTSISNTAVERFSEV